MPAGHLLHTPVFDKSPLVGAMMRRLLVKRALECVSRSKDLPDPDITVVIRTRNNARQLAGLFDDIAAQVFAGKVQVVVVDTESTDGTVEVAYRNGAEVIGVQQAQFSYPKALNIGFEAAHHPFVLTLVGHSSLSSEYLFRSITSYARRERFGGMYGLPLPDVNASWAERYTFGLGAAIVLLLPTRFITRPRMGIMAANCSFVSKEVWQKLGKYDEHYAAGGEDGALGRRMLEAKYEVVFEPALSLHHSHGLGLVGIIRQFREWQRIAKPHPFDGEHIRRYRKDLR